MSTRKYFGTDGIRGHVGEYPITADFMLRLGRAAGAVLTKGQTGGKVVIGKDTRVSGYMFESALEAGLVAAGASVCLLGPMPTPAVAFLTRSLRASAGIVISASHNPHHDNGIKFFSAAGKKLDDEVELAIEAELDQPFTTVSSELLGKAVRINEAAARYIEFCKSTVDADLSLQGLKIVVDCANGASYQVAPKVFAELGAQVIAIANTPDGFNINKDCGSTHLGALIAAVKTHQADVGIAFDGDADRVLFVDSQGAVVDGDDLLFIIARERKRRDELKGPVVGTVMTNFGIERAFGDLGVKFMRAKVGDRFVMQVLEQHQGVLGGEASGHILCLDKSSTGDGIISALQALQALVRAGESIKQALAGVQRLPQRTINVRTKLGAAAVNAPAVQAAFKAVENALAGNGRVILRPSGTEPVVRVTVEAESAELVDALSKQLAEVVAAT